MLLEMLIISMDLSFNRYIVECKLNSLFGGITAPLVLIDT